MEELEGAKLQREVSKLRRTLELAQRSASSQEARPLFSLDQETLSTHPLRDRIEEGISSAAASTPWVQSGRRQPQEEVEEMEDVVEGSPVREDPTP